MVWFVIGEAVVRDGFDHMEWNGKEVAPKRKGVVKFSYPPEKARDAGQTKPMTVHYCHRLNGDITKEFLFPFVT